MTPFRRPARAARLALPAVAIALWLGPYAGPARAGAATLPLDFVDQQLAQGLNQPVGITEVPDPPVIATRRYLFVEQLTGRVGLVAGGTVTTVGTVAGITTDGGERGLLGIAVDPGWPARPYVYVHCTDGRSGNHVAISRFTVTGDLAYTGTGAVSIVGGTRYDLRADFPDNASNHNGGTLQFGPDARLYVSLGDDATGCPAQDLTQAMGKILRLDTTRLPASGTGPAPYALLTPADNPFVAMGDSVAGLVWTEGLRNPFRFTIDRTTGALVIGDVGQNTWEEVSLATDPGMDMGWPLMEGPVSYTTCALTPPAPLTAPIASYAHPTGQAVVGGPRYRRQGTGVGRFPPEYEGDVFFLDYYSGLMRRLNQSGATWSLESAPGQPTGTEWGNGLGNVSQMLESTDGALVYVRQSQGSAGTGEIRRIVYTGSSNVPPDAGAGVALSPPSPNPARGTVTLSWTQAAPGRATLAVHSPDGRRVRTLLDSTEVGPGGHTLGWDGRDAGGRRLHAGIYFVRLETGGVTRSARLVLL